LKLSFLVSHSVDLVTKRFVIQLSLYSIVSRIRIASSELGYGYLVDLQEVFVW
jgi:hypothetical protein